jgi:uncharacterized phiE125 gp8 family phage protein
MSGSIIPSTLSLIEGPAIEPLDLAQVKKHLRFSSTTEDTLLDGWIAAARQYFEEQTGRQVMQATWELWLDAFPSGRIELPKPPLIDVVSVSYVSSDGLVAMDVADYTVMAPGGPQAAPGWVQLPYSGLWPTPQDVSGAVRVRFNAGYGSATGDVPELVKTLLYLLVGHFHKYRSETVETRFESAVSTLPLGVDAFIRGFRHTAMPKYPPRYQVAA